MAEKFGAVANTCLTAIFSSYQLAQTGTAEAIYLPTKTQWLEKLSRTTTLGFSNVKQIPVAPQLKRRNLFEHMNILLHHPSTTQPFEKITERNEKNNIKRFPRILQELNDY